MKNTNLKKERGITLVALVITIVVLLILAGVAIVLLSGENNIINKAQEAREKHEIKTNEEEIELANYETKIEEYSGKTSKPLGNTDDLIPTEAQLAEAIVLEEGVYGFDDDASIIYANGKTRNASLYYDNVEYVWFCDESSAKEKGFEKQFTWYNKKTKQEASISVSLSNFKNPRNANGYIGCIIASFGN